MHIGPPVEVQISSSESQQKHFVRSWWKRLMMTENTGRSYKNCFTAISAQQIEMQPRIRSCVMHSATSSSRITMITTKILNIWNSLILECYLYPYLTTTVSWHVSLTTATSVMETIRANMNTSAKTAPLNFKLHFNINTTVGLWCIQPVIAKLMNLVNLSFSQGKFPTMIKAGQATPQPHNWRNLGWVQITWLNTDGSLI